MKLDPATGLPATNPAQLPDCPVEWPAERPVEPVVLRAAAGDCIEVTLRNRLLEPAVVGTDRGWPSSRRPGVQCQTVQMTGSEGNSQDLTARWQCCRRWSWWIRPMVRMHRCRLRPDPGSGRLQHPAADGSQGPQRRQRCDHLQQQPDPAVGSVGLHPQLVDYDVTRDDGVVVGNNPPGQAS